MNQRRKIAERNAELAKKADDLRASGLSTDEACEKAGITKSIYGYYKYAKDKRAADRSGDKVMITSLPDAPKRQYNRTEQNRTEQESIKSHPEKLL